LWDIYITCIVVVMRGFEPCLFVYWKKKKESCWVVTGYGGSRWSGVLDNLSGSDRTMKWWKNEWMKEVRLGRLCLLGTFFGVTFLHHHLYLIVVQNPNPNIFYEVPTQILTYSFLYAWKQLAFIDKMFSY